MNSASTDVSSEPAYKAIIGCHSKLVTALSSDILSISGKLVTNEFLSPDVMSKMLLQNLTPQEKATHLVLDITDKIKLAPDRFQELIKIFSEQNCTKVILKSLLSHGKPHDQENDSQDCDTEVFSSSQQYAVCEGHNYVHCMHG